MSAHSDDYVPCSDVLIADHGAELLDFGIVDARGRAIGYRVERRTIEHVEIAARAASWSLVCPREDLGRWFTARTHATRDGVRFGPSTGALRARTAEELETLIAARVAGARARYAAAAIRA